MINQCVLEKHVTWPTVAKAYPLASFRWEASTWRTWGQNTLQHAGPVAIFVRILEGRCITCNILQHPSHANASAAVPTHFNLPDHSIEVMALIPLELQQPLNTSRRKAREAFLIHRDQTLEPKGMNRRNERWMFILFSVLNTFISICNLIYQLCSCLFY